MKRQLLLFFLFSMATAIWGQDFDLHYAYYGSNSNPDFEYLNSALPVDFNLDGHMDYVAGGPEHLTLFLNNQSGQLLPQPVYHGFRLSKPMDCFDVNGDGLLDIIAEVKVTDDVVDTQVRLYRQNAIGTFTQIIIASCVPNGIYVVDLNGNGRKDLLVFEQSGEVWAYLNDGTGGFTRSNEVTGVEQCERLLSVDMNNDGLLDIVGMVNFEASGYTVTALVWFQNTYNFEYEIRVLSNVYGAVNDRAELSAFDFDHDGDIDVTAGSYLYTNSGNGSFVETNIGGHWSHTAPADFDGDGDIDFAAIRTGNWENYYSAQSGWVENLGNGQFEHHVLDIGPETDLLTGLVVADMTGDYDPDIMFLTHSNGIRSSFRYFKNYMLGAVVGPIVADFRPSALAGVVPFTVYFENLTSGSANGFTWFFGDNEISRVRTPEHCYMHPGAYSVKLRAKKNDTVVDTCYREHYILVMNNPMPEHTDTLFTDQFIGGSRSPKWLFNNHNRWSMNPSHHSMYINTTEYDRRSDGGLGELAIIDDFLDGTYTVSFRAKTLESLYENFNADFAIVFGYRDPYNYYYVNISCKDGSTCIYHITPYGRRQLIQRYGTWLSHHSNQFVSVTCQDGQAWVVHGDQLLLYADGLDTSGKVGMGSENDKAEFHDFVIRIPGEPAQPPVAALAADAQSGVAPFAVQFSDSSTGEIAEWLWDFGDGSTSTEQHPQHTYLIADTFDVALTVTGPGGSNQVTKPGYIIVNHAAPDARFTADNTEGLAPLTVQFTDNSDGTVTGWLWDFGDGVTSTEQHPQHTYQTADTFDVALTVTGPGGTDLIIMERCVKVSGLSAVADDAGRPMDYRLYANSPNPFNPVTHIQYDVKAAGPVTLAVYDVRGRQVKVLCDEVQSAGRYTAVFDATGLPSGIYILRYTAGTFTGTKKMVLSR